MFTGNALALTARRRSVLMLIAAAASWGATTSLSELVLRRLRPADLLVVELLTAAIVLTGVVAFRRRPHDLVGTRPYVLLGLLEPGLLFLLFDLGLRRTSAVSAGLLVSTQALFGVLAAAVFLRERATVPTMVALLSGVAGAVLITAHGGSEGQSLLGDTLVLAGSAVGGVYVVFARRLPAGVDTLTGTACQLIGALPMAALAAAVTWSSQGSELGDAPATVVAGAVAVGVLGGVVPYLLVNKALHTVRASDAALVLNLTPLFAVAGAVLLLHEVPTVEVAAGGLLLVGGLAVLASSQRAAGANVPDDAADEPGCPAVALGSPPQGERVGVVTAARRSGA